MHEEIEIKPGQITKHSCPKCKGIALYWLNDTGAYLQWYCVECNESGMVSPLLMIKKTS